MGEMFEDAMDRAMLYSISPELTCTCDEVHICQQCDIAEERRKKLIKLLTDEDDLT
tara:strand:- start:610 stop:777 length:168 start_codon:yes stop_codon:yes gene_type:complete